MNKTAEIATLWAAYENEHPNASIAEFCQAYLAGMEEKKAEFWNSPIPPDAASTLIKLTGRITKVHNLNATMAFRTHGLSGFDDFLYLNTIAHASSPKKTDIIYANFNELSSGLLILDRLKTNKLIKEETDSDDRRSKRLSLTKKGSDMLAACYKTLSQINEICFTSASEEQIKYCIQVLTPVESALAENWQKDRSR